MRPQARRLLPRPRQGDPNYYCQGPAELVDGRGARHMNVGGQAIDAAVAGAFLTALAPAALDACLAAARQLEDGHDAALAQHRRQVEQARYNAARAERPTGPSIRTTGSSPAGWNPNGRPPSQLADAEAEHARRETTRPKTLTRRASRRSSSSATTLTPSGPRRPPPTRTASSCCAPCSTK